MQKNDYTISLRANSDELELDIDDLSGIVQQLEAITMGWGMDFSVHILREENLILLD